MKAADNFVDLCLQHAAYLAGRNTISEPVDNIQEGIDSNNFIISE